jgi:serine/threonine protein kinase/WD40 repeat protein
LEELFHQAVALEPAQRPAFLEAACAGDAELRTAVEELLKRDRDEDSSDKFLRSPVAGQVEKLRPLLPTLLDVVQNRPGPTPPTLPTIAGYELLLEIGRGGMGVVYRARQISLDRIVALKMLLASELADTEQLVRFRTEAEALAKLHHANVVTIFEIAESEGRPYFTMEYVAGPSLAEIISGHPQDVAVAARLIEVVARAVHAVHQCGVIHRDLKPANVLLQIADRRSQFGDQTASDPKSAICNLQSTTPKITDFGLAKYQTDVRKLTATGTAMGTPSYMAPEQARGGGAISPATDVYALGSILYEMLAGRPPFDAGSPAETIAQLLNDEPLSPVRLRPNLPRDVVTICLKCLEKSPWKRYATALELAEDLRRFSAGEPIRARPVGFVERSYRWCRRRPLVAGLLTTSTLLALTCIVTVIVYEFRLAAALEKQVSQEHEEIVEQRRTIVQFHVQIGVTAMEGGDTFAAVFHFTEALRLDEGTDSERRHRTRIGTALRHCPRLTEVLSLDGTVLCAERDRVAVMDANRAIEVREMHGSRPLASGLRHTELPREGTLSPDGRFLGVLTEKGTARIWDLARSEPHDLPPAERSGVQRLLFHPDGRVLLVQRTNGAIERWDLASWTQLPWEGLTKGAVLSTLDDDGRWLLTCDAKHDGQEWDVGTGKPFGAPLKIGHPVRTGSIARDGRTLAVIGPDDELLVWDVTAGRQCGKPIRLHGAASRIAFGPEGERIVSICHDRIVRIWQTQTGALLAQTAPLDDGSVSTFFSSDGRYLLTMGEIGGARVWDSATGHAVTPPLRHGGQLASAWFRANGTEVVTVSKTGMTCAWKLPRGPEVRRGAAGAIVPSVASPAKSRSIHFANGLTVRTSGASDGPLEPPRGGEKVVEQAVLSPDGRRLAICEDATTVNLLDATGGEIQTPPLRHRSPVRYAAFSADGQRILTACDDRSLRLWDTATGELLAPPMRHALAILRVSFHDGDVRAHVVHDDDTVSIWDLSQDDRPIGDLLKHAQEIAGRPGDPNWPQQSLDSGPPR